MINYIRGEDKPFQLKVRGALSGDPFDFTGATEIVASFPLTPTTSIDYKLSMAQLSYPTSSLLGIVAGTIAAADGANLQFGQGQLVKLTVTKPSGIRKFEANVLNVSD